jgi:hypothetical protein
LQSGNAIMPFFCALDLLIRESLMRFTDGRVAYGGRLRQEN